LPDRLTPSLSFWKPVGDILLEYKEETFVHGLVSFLIGHLAYIVAFRKIAAKVNLFALVVYGALTALVFFLSKDGTR
jgi:uncharacterized membrane protein YhhN